MNPVYIAWKSIPSFSQCLRISGKSSVKSLTVKSVNPAVCVDNTADGRIAVSIPNAEIIGNATVIEHCPKQDISCIVKIFVFSFIFST